MWNHVVPHFQGFLRNLEPTTKQREAIISHVNSIGTSLRSAYYGSPFGSSPMIITGSTGKGVLVRPLTDVDTLFVLPWPEYDRISAIKGNVQSYLLQEVREVLLDRFPQTEIKADNQVVVVGFPDVKVEVVPAWDFGVRGFLTCYTPNGGSWRWSHPRAEYDDIRFVDSRFDGKASDLIRMLKAWKRACDVPIKSICLEVAVVVFVQRWENRDKGIYFYDWMVRDFFSFLLQFSGGWVKPAGIEERIPLGNEWASKAHSAYNRSLKACDLERADLDDDASSQWAKVFGTQFHSGLQSLYYLAGLRGA